MRRIAIIFFPGNNCEEESKRAIDAVGMQGEIVRWNDTAKIADFDGYLLPGGWSYEDRIRAGVIASKDPVIGALKEQAARGKPIIGICNGCQVLIEAGLVPGIRDELQMALAPNHNPFVSGFYCTWVKVKVNTKGRSIFATAFDEGEIISLPIAHGEGRFTTHEPGLVDTLKANNQITFTYCDAEGNTDGSFPVNPNGALLNAAAISNEQGNVLAIMPHPERATWSRQVPARNSMGEELAPASKIFLSMKDYLR